MRRLLLSCLIFSAAIFPSCSPQNDTAAPAVSRQTVYVRAGDFAPGQLEAHYAKHGCQFGSITQEQYLQQARELLDAPAGKDVLEKIRDDGDILHYRPSTGEFAIMTGRGRIRTYFKADYRYWMRQ